MSKLHAYLNFNGNCEEAFQFYAEVFQKPIAGIYRFGDLPPDENQPPVADEIKDKVMNVTIFLNESVTIMGSDFVQDYCGEFKLIKGNDTYLVLEPESAEETKRIYDALSSGAQCFQMPLGEQFWAELYASFQDKFGTMWMLSYPGNKVPSEAQNS